MSPTENKGDDVDFGDNIDMSTFEQILEMDEPGDNEFSLSIVLGFFDQAKETFTDIQTALQEEDLDKLSSLGHFLKGSSATLGLVKVRDGCEKIQRYGKNEKLDGSALDDNEVCLKNIEEAFKTVKEDYDVVEKLLKDYYDQKEE
ncbi:osomolarity two-component system, phosphorelay intermediate protein YPD1 [Fusarium austroafricanum]|uniref:Osomolarity two-component system, phosphorelay intermediate protein YPD1 n=1 Tax=Fusarium austroafricanum TaxID=2364996 RepID=A0A8H4P0F0_9HYPO|nr:osomolarity two-component system, phosphorelay intermediate protein YPD1 [Fusarium austroafricanum]